MLIIYYLDKRWHKNHRHRFRPTQQTESSGSLKWSLQNKSCPCFYCEASALCSTSALDYFISYSERGHGVNSRAHLLLGPTILRQLLLLLPLVSPLCPPPILQGGRGFLFRRGVICELPAAHRPVIQPALP